VLALDSLHFVFVYRASLEAAKHLPIAPSHLPSSAASNPSARAVTSVVKPIHIDKKSCSIECRKFITVLPVCTTCHSSHCCSMPYAATYDQVQACGVQKRPRGSTQNKRSAIAEIARVFLVTAVVENPTLEAHTVDFYGITML